MKYTDMLGNEIQAGDFVVNATCGNGSGNLRRSLITRLIPYSNKYNQNYYKNHHVLGLKSIIIDQTASWKKGKYTYSKKAHTGQTQQLAKDIDGVIKFNVIKLYQNIEAIFTPEELSYIKQTRIKLSV